MSMPRSTNYPKAQEDQGFISAVLHRLAVRFSETYPSDSYDALSETFNGKSAANLTQEDINLYRYHWVTMVATFFGLPNDCEGKATPSWTNIGERLIGRDNYNELPRMHDFNDIVASFVLLGNLVFALQKTAQNIVKLFTEFLPSVLADEVFEPLLQSAYACPDKMADVLQDKKSPFLVRLLKGIGYGLGSLLGAPLSFLGYHVFKGLHVLGRAVSSPIDSSRKAYKYGMDTTGSEVFARAMYGCSIALTIAAYALLFPLIAAAIAGIAMPLALPASSSWLFPFLGQYLLSIYSTVGIAFNSMVFTLNPLLTINLGQLAVIGAGIGAALPTVGRICEALLRVCRYSWREGLTDVNAKKEEKETRPEEKAEVLGKEIRIQQEKTGTCEPSKNNKNGKIKKKKRSKIDSYDYSVVISPLELSKRKRSNSSAKDLLTVSSGAVLKEVSQNSPRQSPRQKEDADENLIGDENRGVITNRRRASSGRNSRISLREVQEASLDVRDVSCSSSSEGIQQTSSGGSFVEDPVSFECSNKGMPLAPLAGNFSAVFSKGKSRRTTENDEKGSLTGKIRPTSSDELLNNAPRGARRNSDTDVRDISAISLRRSSGQLTNTI